MVRPLRPRRVLLPLFGCDVYPRFVGHGFTTQTSRESSASESRPHFAAYMCNHRTYNRWPRSASSAGPPLVLRFSAAPTARPVDQLLAPGIGAEDDQNPRSVRISIVPPHLDWGASELCKPVLSTISIFNLSPDEAVTIRSLLTDDIQFFTSVGERFAPVVVHPHGNVSVSFLLIPQSLGLIRSRVFISTSVGDLPYIFQAVGIANANGLEPLKFALAPGAPLGRSISVHNPGDKIIRVLEVYTPEDSFQLQLPGVGASDARSEHVDPSKQVSGRFWW